MSEPFIGEIRMFAGNFAPAGHAFCDGQLLAVSQNEALFSLLGTIYGGDGRTTFGLPDLRGRLPLHMGSGPGLTPRPLGQKAGSETTSLTTSNLPSHTHEALVSTAAGTGTNPDGAFLASSPGVRVYRPVPPAAALDADTISTATGASSPHTNVMPFLCINFIIALFGIYPSRS
jgi:microcystin-dependent protein